MKHLAAFFCLLLVLFGCGARISDSQVVQLSQAKADIEASRVVTGDVEKRTLSEAADSRVLSALADLELPPPVVSVKELTATPAAAHKEREDAHAAEVDPPSGVSTETLGIVGGAVGLGLGLLRFFPGPFGTLASIAQTLLAPKKVKEDRDKQRVMVSSLVDFSDDLEGLVAKGGPALMAEMDALKTDHAKTQIRLGVRHLVSDVLS